MAQAVLTTSAVVLAVALAVAVTLMWRLYRDTVRRADAAGRALAAERDRLDEERAARHRYEVAFASISGRGELGEHVLQETATALGLREGLHFDLQVDLVGGGARKPDLLLRVGGGRGVPVDAKASMACWAEAVETPDEHERGQALRAHARNLRDRAGELAGKEYQRWADAVYGVVMFVPADAAVVAALEADQGLLRWLLDRRIFVCGPTGFAVLASAALFAGSDRALAEDTEQLRTRADAAHRAAGNAVEALNVSSTHLQRFLAARRREQDALEAFRAAVTPLSEASASPTPLAEIRRPDDELR